MQPDPELILRDALCVDAPHAPLAQIHRRARALAARERTGRSALAIVAGAVVMSALLVAFSGHSPQAPAGARIPLASAAAGVTSPAPLPTIS